MVTSSLGEDDFSEAIGAFNPKFHSFSVDLPPIRVGEYCGGGGSSGDLFSSSASSSLKREKKKRDRKRIQGCMQI